MEILYKVYALPDKHNSIIGVESTGFHNEQDLIEKGYVLIDEGSDWETHFHAQPNYLKNKYGLATFDEKMLPNYKLVKNKVIERTQEEKESLYPTPIPEATEQEKINAMLMLEIVKLKSSNVPVAINIVDNSLLLDTLKSYYALGLFTDSDIKMFVLVGDITPEEYKSITGKEYEE